MPRACPAYSAIGSPNNGSSPNMKVDPIFSPPHGISFAVTTSTIFVDAKEDLNLIIFVGLRIKAPTPPTITPGFYGRVG